MNKGEAVFEEFSEFKKWSSTALKTFNKFHHNNDQQ